MHNLLDVPLHTLVQGTRGNFDVPRLAPEWPQGFLRGLLALEAALKYQTVDSGNVSLASFILYKK